jgi:hypothetical protein
MCGRDELMHEERAKRRPDSVLAGIPAAEMSERDLARLVTLHFEFDRHTSRVQLHNEIGRLLRHIVHLRSEAHDLKHRLHLSEEISLSLALSAAAAANPLTNLPTEGGENPMLKVQNYIEKPAEPRRVKAFQVPDGETIPVDDGAGNSVTAVGGDYIEIDEANNHVQAFKKDVFEAKFALDEPVAA